MVWFVAIAAVVNMALGFVLAMYMQRAGLVGGSHPAVDEHEAPHEEPESHSPIAHAEPAPIAEAPAPPTPVAAPAPVEAAATPEVAEAPPVAELEDNVLAGIEEFRNQLAQMKAQPGDAAEVAEAASA